MSLLSSILERLSGRGSSGASNEKQNSLLDTVIGLIGNPQTGGLTGLLNQFKSKGLGDIVSSWVGTGQNQPIDPNQVERVLGQDKVQEIAAKLGVSPEEVSAKLAKLLPEVVDKVTPDGNIPADESLGARIGAVKKLFGK